MPPNQYALADLDAHTRYKLLGAIIIPRPIAWVTSVNANGLVNAAPYSFFNVFAEDPALIVLGLHWRPDETALKDTRANIAGNGEFVVNMVDEPLAQAMSDTAIDFPPDVSEVEALGLRLSGSTGVKPPRLADAPFSLECRRKVAMQFTPERELLIGEVERIHARPGLIDEKTMRVHLDAYKPIGRIFGELYCRDYEVFRLERPGYEEWKAKRDGGK